LVAVRHEAIQELAVRLVAPVARSPRPGGIGIRRGHDRALSGLGQGLFTHSPHERPDQSVLFWDFTLDATGGGGRALPAPGAPRSLPSCRYHCPVLGRLYISHRGKLRTQARSASEGAVFCPSLALRACVRHSPGEAGPCEPPWRG